MKSDIEIAQEAVLWPIQKVAEHLDIPEDDLDWARHLQKWAKKR